MIKVNQVSIAELKASLAEPHKKHLDPNSPGPARMMAAKGIAPLPPREMVIVLCGLSLDENNEIANAAKISIGKLPEKIINTALDASLPSSALTILISLLNERYELIEKLVLLKDTPDSAIAAIAASVPEHIAEIIANNQERAQRSDAIVRAIKQNPNLLRSSRDRLFDFLVRAGVIYEDMPEFAEAMARLSPKEMLEVADKVELPPMATELIQDNADSEERAKVVADILDSKETINNQTDEEKGSDEETQKRMPMLKYIGSLGMSQRVALAIKGNKEARTILLRDMNRVVASAAIRNPRITEQEVVSASQSRQICDEVIRIISASKELSRPYGVKVALVNNPKTPLPTAMRMITLLREADVRALAKSKNVSTAVANQARRLLAQKKH
ncbi:MAG: hypothetical protein JW841_12410 [Deltaproteobacteria bacterium]|nr:hypothetical protein [Deltaproteobacteria bacterium]